MHKRDLKCRKASFGRFEVRFVASLVSENRLSSRRARLLIMPGDSRSIKESTSFDKFVHDRYHSGFVYRFYFYFYFYFYFFFRFSCAVQPPRGWRATRAPCVPLFNGAAIIIVIGVGVNGDRVLLIQWPREMGWKCRADIVTGGVRFLFTIVLRPRSSRTPNRRGGILTGGSKN